MPSSESARPLSEFSFSLPQSTFERAMLSARHRGVNTPEVIRQAVGLRRVIEQVRDQKVHNPKLTSDAASTILELNVLAAHADIESVVNDEQPHVITINLSPRLLSEFDQIYLVEGFSSIDEYINAALIMFHAIEGEDEWT